MPDWLLLVLVAGTLLAVISILTFLAGAILAIFDAVVEYTFPGLKLPLRLAGIYLGLYKKQALGYINLDDVPLTHARDHEDALENAQSDAQHASQAASDKQWQVARFYWSKAASRFRVNSDEFILYLILAEKARNKGAHSHT